MKQCYMCKETKINEEFYIIEKSTGRLRSWCRECEKIYYSKTNIEKRKINKERTMKLEFKGIRQCSTCGEPKQNKEFYIDKRRNKLYSACKECFGEHRKNTYAIFKQAAYDVLGNKCTTCGFDDIRALQIDHIHGGGNRRKRENIEHLEQIYQKIIETKTSEFQLLCANCNYIKRVENLEARGRPKLDSSAL